MVQQELFLKTSLLSKGLPESRSRIPSPGPPDLPDGFFYQPDFISVAEENALQDEISRIEFQTFDFQGYKAKRRIVAYGFEYDFGSRRTNPTRPIPAFLEPLRERAAAWASVRASEIVESVVIEYPAGAPIGWHRDVPQFETIIGISLKSECRMRFKPYRKEGRISSISLDPRSVYRMQGPARWAYQHSIPAVKALRYSITFRTVRKKTANQPSSSD